METLVKALCLSWVGYSDHMLMARHLRQLQWRLVLMSILLLQKPSRTSKTKDHSACLARRLPIWKKGDIGNLLVEGCSLQSRLCKFSPYSTVDHGNLARSFSKLMLPYNYLRIRVRVAFSKQMTWLILETMQRNPSWTSSGWNILMLSQFARCFARGKCWPSWSAPRGVWWNHCC